METAKLTDFIITKLTKLTVQSWFLHVKTANILKAHDLIEHSKKSSECFEYFFFKMSDVEKIRVALGACWYNLYEFYASLQIFLNFLIL